MMPSAYALKKYLSEKSHCFWRGENLRHFESAPIYYFPDHEQFNSDDVDTVARNLLRGPLRLPHDTIVFEVADRHPYVKAVVALVTQSDRGAEGFLVVSQRIGNRFSDVLAHASFSDGGFADTEINPKVGDAKLSASYAEVLNAAVWRALAILSQSPGISDQHVPHTRRPKLARAGVSGWTWRMVNIDLVRIRAAARQAGGSHASPRWHIRRGHWRTLPDGHRVFVRSCEVGDPARGGVLKDYCVTMGEAA